MADITGFKEFAELLDEFSNELYLLANTKVNEALDDATEKTALQVERTAKREAPVDDGILRASIGTVRERQARYSVGTNLEYAHPMEYGSVPHAITPNGDYPLVFEVDGKVISTYHVDHPGHRAYPFIRPAIAKNRSALEENIKQEIDDLLGDI